MNGVDSMSFGDVGLVVSLSDELDNILIRLELIGTILDDCDAEENLSF